MILLVSDNVRKHEELRRIFRRYNVRLDRRSRAEFDPTRIAELFEAQPKLKAILDEASQLIAEGERAHLSAWRDSHNHLRTVANRGRLRAWVRTDEGIREECYEREIAGWLDHTRQPADEDVFDWDAIFVVGTTGLTYHQMRQRGLKNSVRDLMASDFLVAHLYFAERVDLRWSPLKQAQTVDFDQSVAAFLRDNELVDRDAMAPYGLSALLDHVLADGVFFRAAENRRQRNYWAPGLNGGVPLTPKRDPVHELTFMVHDLMHQAIPDLVFTGVPAGADRALYRNVYSAWRMISEAFTIVLADMLFVDGLVGKGLDYDFTKRKIWPLFEKLDVSFGDALQEQLRRLLDANVRYALAGDDSELRALRRSDVSVKDFDEALDAYKGKYEGYFRADWEWTVTNFDAMAERSDVFERWGALATPELFAACGLRMLDDVVAELASRDTSSLDTLIDTVFELAFAHIAERLAPPATSDDETGILNAARRYMTGQLLLFAAWDVLPSSRELGEAMSRTLRQPLQRETIRRLRARFAAHLDDLSERKLISDDDRRTWLGAHPLFDPSYVAYDRKGITKSLREVALACFAEPEVTSAHATICGAHLVDLQRMWDAAEPLAHSEKLAALLHAAGAQFHDDERRFVSEANVALCGIGGMPVRLREGQAYVAGSGLEQVVTEGHSMMGFASFMSYLNPRGRDAESMFHTVARLGHHSIAHTVTINVLFAGHSSAVEHELATQRDIVHLARLTVARTAAQDDPPLRIPAALIDTATRIRDAIGTPARETADEREAINQLFPAAKASLLLVSGSLRNFQKLVAQRDDDGKEAELRVLLRSLHTTLHALWPALF